MQNILSQRFEGCSGSSAHPLKWIFIVLRGNLRTLSLPKRYHAIIRDDEMETYKSGDMTLIYLGMLGNAYNTKFLARVEEEEENEEEEEDEVLRKSERRRKL
uniref:Reverse gyrase 1 n=1 Tax=Lygus hesperus TaxID=30085 RepID=A0A0A9XKQ6_LYGHE